MNDQIQLNNTLVSERDLACPFSDTKIEPVTKRLSDFWTLYGLIAGLENQACFKLIA